MLTWHPTTAWQNKSEFNLNEDEIMEFAFTEYQKALRQEVHSFLQAELPEGWVDYTGTTIDDSLVHVENGFQVFKEMAVKMGKKGWLSMTWPKEYGGQARSYVDYLVFLEEIAAYGSPGLNAMGPKMLAPTLIIYGSEEQKKKYLKNMADGTVFWCEGFSEPEAGSDMASLQTRAVKDGNSYIINGQKTWSTFAPSCTMAAVLARTDPESKRHRGISFFLADLSTPGIDVRPIDNIAGEPHFGEIFFEDARVPAENIVGQENEGWKVAQAFLGFERVYIAPIAVINSLIERLVRYFKTVDVNKEQVKASLTNMAIEAEVGRLLCYQVAWMQDKGTATEWHAAMTRLYSTRLMRNVACEAVRLLGLYGQLDLHDDKAPLKGWIEHLYMSMLGATIAAGTSEIQKLIIALRGLGLPSS
jgi:alkylation response protein AidB-like acyl-CoA dehydrogenase